MTPAADSYTNSRGETAMSYAIFRAIPAERICNRLRLKPSVKVKSRRERREANGTITNKKEGS